MIPYLVLDYNPENPIINGLIEAIKSENRILLFNSNLKLYPNSSFDFLLAIGLESELKIDKKDTKGLDKLREYYQSTNDWIFGHISYDFKNSIESLESKNEDIIELPVMAFFKPQILIQAKNNKLYISISENYNEIRKRRVDDYIAFAFNYKTDKERKTQFKSIDIKHRISFDDYRKRFEQIKQNIQLGNIYEINYCQEFYVENFEGEPIEIYERLNAISPTPFSTFYRIDNHYLMSASPERYLKKVQNQVISQPMKGTARRHSDPIEDQNSIHNLLNSKKEKAENVMIVDLVRNDLSRTATPGSVVVKELFGIHTFPQVHQMVSTVASELDAQYDIFDVIRTSFPMGSMTGAPKISAMQIIDKMEETSRGLYSGTVGYITPEGDADFNVIIRSLIYNRQKKHLSFITGGAITILSEAKSEYDECMLKAESIFRSLESLG